MRVRNGGKKAAAYNGVKVKTGLKLDTAQEMSANRATRYKWDNKSRNLKHFLKKSSTMLCYVPKDGFVYRNIVLHWQGEYYCTCI